MNPKQQILGSSLFFVLLSVTSVGYAQLEGGPYRINKTTIDNGGGVSSGGLYTLTGTIGQPDASEEASVGGIYTLTGGFWSNGGFVVVGDDFFIDGFENP